ncbi:MAG: hypothetical protein Q8761_02265 [Sweet potato little leaf phytoplasma]|nr:hypothetical protein [Sweet potato little leaf phytoplasma]
MNIVKDFEDSLYDYLEAMLPQGFNIIFNYNNGPEQIRPYVVIDTSDMRKVGGSYTSHVVPDGENNMMTVTTYECPVMFQFVGRYDKLVTLGDVVFNFDVEMETPLGRQLMVKHNLCLLNQEEVVRIADSRVTDTDVYYQKVCTFAFTAETRQTIDTIASVDVEGHYSGAIGDVVSHTKVPSISPLMSARSI